jgi:hypothetical protein
MPTALHIEKHFTATESVRDVVIGMSDGLTVPFALAAGLSGAVASTKLIVIAGLAEIAAGSIAMGLGGYLAARTDSEHYHAEEEREYREIVELPVQEEREVAEVFEGYGLTPEQAAPVVAAIRSDPKRWVDFMMRYELGLEAPAPRRAQRRHHRHLLHRRRDDSAFAVLRCGHRHPRPLDLDGGDADRAVRLWLRQGAVDGNPPASWRHPHGRDRRSRRRRGLRPGAGNKLSADALTPCHGSHHQKWFGAGRDGIG